MSVGLRSVLPLPFHCGGIQYVKFIPFLISVLARVTMVARIIDVYTSVADSARLRVLPRASRSSREEPKTVVAHSVECSVRALAPTGHLHDDGIARRSAYHVSRIIRANRLHRALRTCREQLDVFIAMRILRLTPIRVSTRDTSRFRRTG